MQRELKEDQEEEYVVVSVKDSGTGIDPEILTKLFERFASKSFSGTGLGLFISKSGATFSFSLPLAISNNKDYSNTNHSNVS
jgi:signal transduction histidine kinase